MELNPEKRLPKLYRLQTLFYWRLEDFLAIAKPLPETRANRAYEQSARRVNGAERGLPTVK